MRETSPIDSLADAFVRDLADLHPMVAIGLGLPSSRLLPDYSPDGQAEIAERNDAFLAEIAAAEPRDEIDEVTKDAVAERHGLERELYDAGEYRRDLNNIASPMQELRDSFDLMPSQTEADWEKIAATLRALPAALEGFEASLREGVRLDQMPALRQVRLAIKEAQENADPEGSYFVSFVRNAAIEGGELPQSLVDELEAGAADARQAFADFASFLSNKVAPDAPEADAVGRERYELFSRFFLGSAVDLDETYEWGLDELARIVAEQEATVRELFGECVSIPETMERLNADPERKLHGTEALREWMQATANHAIEDLSGVHFDIPGPVRTLEAMIAPTNTGGIYYTSPSDDFSRPGRMWWSVPEGVNEFSTWYEKTTVYHEGVPGHHLQIAQTVYRRELLNLWRRSYVWVSGYGEGWALYAERLMESLGYLDDPADRLGMLDAQRLRATRVVLDIGVHLCKPYPEAFGGGEWTYENAWRFLKENAAGTDQFLRFELHRYLGWPGQAPSYKVGQRLWEQLRDEAQARAVAAGEEFSLKDFHRRALDVGSVGLDVLRRALER